MAETNGITILRMPRRMPRANTVGERFLVSVRRVCIDHSFILGERRLRRVLS
ncbi:MAG: hypothetical protein ACTHMR_18115 [Thermomicrobiales bacterium]